MEKPFSRSLFCYLVIYCNSEDFEQKTQISARRGILPNLLTLSETDTLHKWQLNTYPSTFPRPEDIPCYQHCVRRLYFKSTSHCCSRFNGFIKKHSDILESGLERRRKGRDDCRSEPIFQRGNRASTPRLGKASTR